MTHRDYDPTKPDRPVNHPGEPDPTQDRIAYRHGNYVTQHDWDTDRTLTTTIVSVLESVPEVSLREGDPLCEAVDPEALDALCRHGDTALDVEVRFSYQNCSVLVSADGTVAVQPGLGRPTH